MSEPTAAAATFLVRDIALDEFSQPHIPFLSRHLRGLVGVGLVGLVGVSVFALMTLPQRPEFKAAYPLLTAAINAVGALVAIAFVVIAIGFALIGPFWRMEQAARSDTFTRNPLSDAETEAVVPVAGRRLGEIAGFIARLRAGTAALGPPPERRSARAVALIALALMVFSLPLVIGLLMSRNLWTIPEHVRGLIGTALNATMPFLALWLLLRGRRALEPTAATLQAHDTRAPVLLLRSFLDDKVKLWLRWKWWILPANASKTRLEQVLAEQLSAAGPFIGIGDPKEGVPQFGAARAYLSDADWQRQVIDWLAQARIIALIAGKTPWVRWELGQVLAREHAGKLVLVLPPVTATERAERWSAVTPAFDGSPWHGAISGLDATDALAVVLREGGEAVVIRSRGRMARDYALAIMIATELILGEQGSEQSRRGAELLLAAPPPAPATARTGRALRLAVASLALVALAIAAAAQVPAVRALVASLLPSEEGFVRKLEAEIAADPALAPTYAVIRGGWPDDYARILAAGARGLKESNGNYAAARTAIQAEATAWRRRNAGHAGFGDNAALEAMLTAMVQVTRKLNEIDAALCGRVERGGRPELERGLAGLKREQAADVRALDRKSGSAMIELIGAGRLRPETRPATTSADSVLLARTLLAKGVTLADIEAHEKGLMPPERMCAHSLALIEGVLAVPDPAARGRLMRDIALPLAGQ